jgi:uncharacterized protein YprB with RNaseH-like and TPR domain
VVSEADDLRERLEGLGVRLGLAGLRPRPESASPPPLPAPPRDSIDDWVSGRIVEGEAGVCFLSESCYPLEHIHGRMPLGALLECTPAWLDMLAGDPDEPCRDFRRLAFLDTETTGLAGGTGTYAFMVGLGVFEGDGFAVRQYFMRDIPEEAAMLALVRRDLEPRSGLVTFNGRAFDWPLLETRFAMNRQPVPRTALYHLDLLLPARRLWRRRLQSCALASLEEHVLELQRSNDDVPGWAIPGLYRDFLQWGRAEPLRRVFYHNAHDILSLATLAALLCRSVREPLRILRHGEDLFSLAQRFEAQGDAATAMALYAHCLRCQLPAKTRHAAMHRLSRLHRRAGEEQEALALWHSLAELGDLEACVALAKHYEHRTDDLAQARRMALRALGLLRQLRYPDRRRLAELEHRLRRLEEKERRRRALTAGPPCSAT